MLSDAAGLPLVVDVSAAAPPTSRRSSLLFMALPLIRSRRGPRRRRPDKARADKGYDSAELRAWLHRRGVTPRIARRGIESSQRLGRTVGRSSARSPGFPATVRYERSANLFAAFLTLAATLTCWKQLAT